MLKRVALIGPESSGKSTLAAGLAAHCKTVWVPEFLRDYAAQVFASGRKTTLDDILPIARGQCEAEDALSGKANKILFCDTTLSVIVAWSYYYFHDCPAEVLAEETRRRYDLTLLLYPDLPWIDDGIRESPVLRDAFFDTFEALLRHRQEPYEIIRDQGEKRQNNAIQALIRHEVWTF